MIPRDLPALIDKDQNYEPSEAFKKAFEEINDGLMTPLGGYDIVAIIRAADEYIDAARHDKEAGAQ